MVKRKVTILEPAAVAVAEIAFFIEGKGMPQTAKKFVQETFSFFEKLSNELIEYRPCIYERWKDLNYHCITYKKKYIVAYISQEKEIIICDFVSAKILK